MTLFRAEVEGPEPLEPVASIEFEGSWERPGGDRSHYFLVEHDTPDMAAKVVLDALQPQGSWSLLTIVGLVCPATWPGLGRDRDVDWDEVAARCGLTALQGDVLRSLLLAAEPAWIIVNESGNADRGLVERALDDLERRGLITRTREPSCDPTGSAGELADWSAISDDGWNVIGLIKRPWYSVTAGRRP